MLVGSGEKFIEPVNNTVVCSEVFQLFHKCTGKFIEVALDTANPFTLCTNEHAFGYYRNLTYFFNLLQENYDKKTGIICSEEYLNKNRMSVIGHIVATSKGLWESGNCDDCYMDQNNLYQNFSLHTIEFQKAHAEYANCSRNSNASVICEKCMSYYLRMNELFDFEKSKKEGHICFDLEDIMNKTRQEWSVVYKCCKNKRDSLKAFYSLFSTIIILTFVFYSTIYFTGSSYTETTTLDAREISNNQPMQPNTSSSSSSSSTGSGNSSKETPKSDKKMLINDDDSDDEPNILSSPSINRNQIILDN
ncbi:osteopetrosis-associated transmembrane protein 1 isoform X2 [Chironomus tepperi]|uniref:osteopetrosis-associated transmembrane protein 1 isoform X2 n=1 Tax=Chironomus tepperi TaxID=113505 RepID=UPI00391F0002